MDELLAEIEALWTRQEERYRETRGSYEEGYLDALSYVVGRIEEALE